jgi:hypothetical protein
MRDFEPMKPGQFNLQFPKTGRLRLFFHILSFAILSLRLMFMYAKNHGVGNSPPNFRGVL